MMGCIFGCGDRYELHSLSHYRSLRGVFLALGETVHEEPPSQRVLGLRASAQITKPERASRKTRHSR